MMDRARARRRHFRPISAVFLSAPAAQEQQRGGDGDSGGGGNVI